ncbi:S1 family peptidase [Streptosporangium sp. NPDC023615]|uniref:S1 family peptidase n=1 Tax=Streptosporangium sp. NPDC023615 TaxID=3154794 RepID=UPI0034207D8C
MSRSHVAVAGCVLAITALVSPAVPASAVPPAGPAAGTTTVPGLPPAQGVPTARTPGTPGASEGAGTATARTSRIAPPPGMLGALQRDLGLTEEQAQERLLNEARLTPIAERLLKVLGPRFGGAWLRGSSAHTLVVATTSAADIPVILAAGAQAEVVTRPLTLLVDLKEKLDTALPPKPLVSSVRYVDVKSNRVIVLAPRPDEASTIIEAAGIASEAVVVLPSSEAPLLLFDLVGGNAFYIGVTRRCSIAFPVLKNAQTGFLTAGHCGKKGTATTGFNRIAQGVFQASNFPVDDFAWVAVNPAWKATPGVDNGQGGVVPVSGAKVAIEGASVCRAGSTTDWHCGVIQQRDASVTYPQGTVFGLTRTSVCAEAGDSGGSFISVDQAQGIASGGSGDCNLGGVTYFQPILEALRAYGLELRTTAGNPPPPSTGTCTGYASTYDGVLKAGESAYQPRKLHYTTKVKGNHLGCLDGPLGADLDLYLQKLVGAAWKTVATSDGAGPDEKIGYVGTPGRYRYRVTATAGSGDYTLGFTAP